MPFESASYADRMALDLPDDPFPGTIGPSNNRRRRTESFPGPSPMSARTCRLPQLNWRHRSGTRMGTGTNCRIGRPCIVPDCITVQPFGDDGSSKQYTVWVEPTATSAGAETSDAGRGLVPSSLSEWSLSTARNSPVESDLFEDGAIGTDGSGSLVSSFAALLLFRRFFRFEEDKRNPFVKPRPPPPPPLLLPFSDLLFVSVDADFVLALFALDAVSFGGIASSAERDA